MTLWRIRVCGNNWIIHLISTTEPSIEYSSGYLGISKLDWTPLDDKRMTDNLLSVDWSNVHLISYRETSEEEVYPQPKSIPVIRPEDIGRDSRGREIILLSLAKKLLKQ